MLNKWGTLCSRLSELIWEYFLVWVNVCWVFTEALDESFQVDIVGQPVRKNFSGEENFLVKARMYRSQVNTGWLFMTVTCWVVLVRRWWTWKLVWNHFERKIVFQVATIGCLILCVWKLRIYQQLQNIPKFRGICNFRSFKSKTVSWRNKFELSRLFKPWRHQAQPFITSWHNLPCICVSIF